MEVCWRLVLLRSSMEGTIAGVSTPESPCQSDQKLCCLESGDLVLVLDHRDLWLSLPFLWLQLLPDTGLRMLTDTSMDLLHRRRRHRPLCCCGFLLHASHPCRRKILHRGRKSCGACPDAPRLIWGSEGRRCQPGEVRLALGQDGVGQPQHNVLQFGVVLLAHPALCV